MSKILIGSPVRQKSSILKEFLAGLGDAEKGSHQIAYYFIDDNCDILSSKMLEIFGRKSNAIITKGSLIFKSENQYEEHNWKADIFEKVATFKNAIIEYCINNEFDYLFLIDSDIVIDKRTILQLLSDNVDIVSNVFWSQWRKNDPLTAQCFWIPDLYLQYIEFGVPRPTEEADKIRIDMNEQLKVPGLYKVDGLGACTLISRKALEKGVNFTAIPNLKIPGEDRHFCIRAGVAGIDLYMDTVYPAYHIYKEEYLSRVDEFRAEGFKYDMCQEFEIDERKVKPFPYIRRWFVRIGNKIVRVFSD